MKTLIFCVALFSVLLIFSCNPETFVQRSQATLIYTGDSNLDGCGYIFTIGGTDCKAVNEEMISTRFSTGEPFGVIIEHTDGGNDFSCSNSISYETMKLLSIKDF